MSIKKLIIISPHPDDECLGLAGTILKKKSQGYKIVNIFITSLKNTHYSQKIKDKQILEIKNCHKILKIDKNYFLDFPPTTLQKVGTKKIIEMISKIFKKEKPREVYLPFVNDAHDDHYISYKAGLACCKWFRNNFIKSVYSYETLSETHMANSKKRENIFYPNYFIDISKYIKIKLKAIKAYKTQIKSHPFPRSLNSIKSLAALRGSSSGFKYAESFEAIIIREE